MGYRIPSNSIKKIYKLQHIKEAKTKAYERLLEKEIYLNTIK